MSPTVRRVCAGLIIALGMTQGALAQTPARAALTPPMGWDPWNAFRTDVSEAKIMAVADALVKTGLADAGYRYVNVDDGWWLNRRADGRLVVRTSMFPSAAPATPGGETSLRPFVDRLHAMGLKAGIYTDIGRNVCSQAFDAKSPNLPVGSVAEREVGSMDHQAQDMRLLFGDWKFDFIKVDACGLADYAPDKAVVKDGTFRAFDPIIVRGKPDLTDEAKVEALYASLNSAIAAVRPGGDYVLSICAWGEADVANWANKYGAMWRTSADISANWRSMLRNFDSAASHPEKAGPGHWNDPDMLQIGNGEFTADHPIEARAHMSLWAILSAPLLLGSDITKWPQAMVDIAGNRDVIAIDQDPAGKQGVILSKDDTSEIVVKALADGGQAVAVINRTATPTTVILNRAQLGYDDATPLVVRDLWTHQDRAFGALTLTAALLPHQVALYRFSKQP